MHTHSALAITKIEPGILSICRGLKPMAKDNVAAISSLHKKQPGETLFSEGAPADAVYEVIKGRLRLFKMLPDGRRQIIGFPAKGHLLGLAPEGVYAYSAEAVCETTICRYPRPSFERLVETVPGFAHRLITMTCDELRFAQDQLLLLGRKTAMERVASLLILLAEEGGENRDEFPIEMTRVDMADYLGLTIETVSRTLSRAKREKLIEMPIADRIRIIDRDRFDEIAQGQ